MSRAWGNRARSRRSVPRLAATLALIGATGSIAVSPAPASAAIGASPQWSVTSVSRPTNFAAGDETGKDAYVVTVTNSGGAPSNGEPVVITDEPPEGLALAQAREPFGEDLLAKTQGGESSKVSCALSSCTFSGTVQPDDTLNVTFPVDVPAGAPGEVTNAVHVAGGGAPSVSLQTPTTIGAESAVFGLASGGASTALSTVQAGGHPDLTTAIAFNTVNSEGALPGDPKDTTDELPPGFAGDLVDTPACQPAAFLKSECPTPTQVGVTTITLSQASPTSGAHLEPLYNLVPGPGDVAKLGFKVAQFAYEGDVTIRSDYGLKTTFHNATAGYVEVDGVSLTVWGVPADPIHDPLRWKLGAHGSPSQGRFGDSSDAVPAPFFTSPTACGEPLQAEFEVNSWQQPGHSVTEKMPFGPLVGCDALGMTPTLTAEATSDEAYSPTGLNLAMNIPQTYENAQGLATSTLRKAVVTLPEGMTVNPSAGAGLAGCTPAQLQEEGVQEEEGKGCPNESKLGTVEIVTPSLKETVTGSVYLAMPYDNPFSEPGHPNGSLLALYIVARIPDRGVLVKAAGEVKADPLTGRLVTTFDTGDPNLPHGGLPPLPFSLFTFKFIQGPTSPLVTPPSCGRYTVTAQLSPWSDPSLALSPEIPSFPIVSGFGRGPCPAGATPPFNPQVLAGTQNNVAGSYSPFYLRIVRQDGEQELTKFTSIFPPGLTGNLSGIPFCPEADIEAARSTTGAQQLEQPSCPQSSEIGHTLVGAGVGSVLVQAPGKIYLAGPYKGSALSVVSITAAKVGPFDLGTVVIRFALSINPLTAQVEISGAGSDPIPYIIRGVVVHVRDIRAYIDREKFILNPTTCNPSSISEAITGAGANPAIPADQMTVGASARFQAADCASLKFTPSFTVSTSGKTSRTRGASLSVKLAYPANSLGRQANIKSVKVDLPRQLPSRLTTLQKACTAAQFDANPAGCPAASIVGHAKAITPILPVPLEGPAYFVSYGGAKFPELVIVLQGYGFTIDLHGETFISKAGITSSTFRAVPDEPVTSFELTLPQGPNSALAANGNLCTSKLAMPTTFTAQNGAVIHQSTKIGVTGCAKHKSKKAKKEKRPHKSPKKRV